MNDKVIILDCSYIGHQARLTLSDLSIDDQPTGVLFGFLVRLLSLGEELRTNRVVFCWDSKASYRKQLLPSYKEGRLKRTDEEKASIKVMHNQLRLLRRTILPAIGFKNHLIQYGYEADDHIAAICKREVLSELVIVSADHDLFQCLSSNVSMYNPSSKKTMTDTKFKGLYGIHPIEWAIVKAVSGCPSDNIPGISGVGEGSAVKYVRGKTNEIRPHILKKIRSGVKGALESYLPLVQLPLQLPEHPLKTKRIETCKLYMKELLRVAKKYEFRTMVDRDRARWRSWLKGKGITRTRGWR